VEQGHLRQRPGDRFNCLFEFSTDDTWRRKACSVTKTLKPYDRGGGRTTARRDCDTARSTSWRNYVDVDVIDEEDTSEQPSSQHRVPCRVVGEDQ
jgi:hypothetical protein